MMKPSLESEAPATPQETGKDALQSIDIKDLKLAGLPWQNASGDQSCEGMVELMVEGKKFYLIYNKIEEKKSGYNYDCEVFYILPEGEKPSRTLKLRVGRSYLWFRVEFIIRTKKSSATTAIFRNELMRQGDKGSLPKGVGLELYKKLLDYIQTRTNEVNKPIMHSVLRQPGSETRPMTTERWDEIFVPLLTERGYQVSDGGSSWTKLYQPSREGSE